jgi:hypothetical protein
MNSNTHSNSKLMVGLAIMLIASAAGAASSSINNLGMELSAKVARERIVQNKQEREFNRDRRAYSNEECGTVSIGNNYGDEPAARERVNPRQRVVVITAPVINAANCR